MCEELTKLEIKDIDYERKKIAVNGKGGKLPTFSIIDDEFLSDFKHINYVLCRPFRAQIFFDSSRGLHPGLHAVAPVGLDIGNEKSFKLSSTLL